MGIDNPFLYHVLTLAPNIYRAQRKQAQFVLSAHLILYVYHYHIIAQLYHQFPTYYMVGFRDPRIPHDITIFVV